MTSVEYIDHTADIGIQIYADTLSECFAAAARAMFDIIVDLDQGQVAEIKSIELEASSLPRLMIFWLEELLFLQEVDDFLCFQFEIVTISENQLQARLGGEILDSSRHVIKTEIKAVTYHQLVVEKRGEGYFAQVIFDL